jgi:uncharacterized protein (TIGR00369 family)
MLSAISCKRVTSACFLLTCNACADIIEFVNQKTVQASKCYVCGSDNLRGLNIPFTLWDGKVTAEFTASDDYCGFDGVIHGGILFALVDEAMMYLIHGNAIRAITSEVTIRMKNFARTNEPIRIEASDLKAEEHMVTCRATIIDKNDRLICKASGKFLYYDKKYPFKKSGL